MNGRALLIAGAVCLLGVVGVTAFPQLSRREDPRSLPQPPAPRPHVVINEAVRTLLYLPLYHAVASGYFANEGLNVEVVTGGTATASFSAMLAGEAQFSQADPMYVPISREKGAKTRVVAQVVGRIAVWGLATGKSPSVDGWSISAVRGKRVATQVRPMTAFVYANQAVRELGLDPERDVELLSIKPPGEIVPLLNGQAAFAFTLEPNTSIAESKGAHVVLSYPTRLGDQVFTGLMTTEKYIRENRQTVEKVVRAFQRALTDIHTNAEVALPTAAKYFPSVPLAVLSAALRRITGELVIPKSIAISSESWDRAVRARVEAGDLKRAVPIDEACDLSIMNIVP